MKIKAKAAMAAILFSAAVNFSACAYGPPQDDFESVDSDVVSQPESKNTSTVYDENDKSDTEPDEDFDPDDNMNVLVYGPPG